MPHQNCRTGAMQPKTSVMKRNIKPPDLIACACEACNVVVFRTTARQVKARPDAVHLSMLQAYELHQKKSGRPCKAPPFEVVLQAAYATVTHVPGVVSQVKVRS
jgi:hypothetical protein